MYLKGIEVHKLIEEIDENVIRSDSSLSKIRHWLEHHDPINGIYLFPEDTVKNSKVLNEAKRTMTPAT